MPIRILASVTSSAGRAGRSCTRSCPALVREQQVDLVIANAENIAGGSGITQNLFHKIRSYGVDVVTLGDHVYKKLDIVPTLQSSERIVRPANLSAQRRRAHVHRRHHQQPACRSASSALLGRIFMNNCPPTIPSPPPTAC